MVRDREGGAEKYVEGSKRKRDRTAFYRQLQMRSVNQEKDK